MNALLILALLVLIAVLVLVHRGMFPHGTIDLRQPVDNAARKFGEATEYFRAEVIDVSGNTHVALLTRDAVQEGLLRGLRNQEDL